MTPTSPKKVINVLLDLSGTLHIANSPTPNAIEALSRLRRAATVLDSQNSGSFRLRFCSNTSKESSTDLISRLHRIGFSDIRPSELFTSLDACAKICHDLQLKPLLLLSRSATLSPYFQSLEGAFSPHFHMSASDGIDQGKGSVPKPSEASSERLRNLDSVVIGLEPELMTYDWLNEAFRILSNEYGSLGEGRKSKLIATHRAAYFRPSVDEPLSLGPGPWIGALETAVGNSAVICGKPTREFFEACLKDMDDEAGRVQDSKSGSRNIIVGDDVQQDLGGGAIDLGLERILGKYRPGDEQKATTAVDGVFDSLAAWVDALMEQKDFEACR